jgi:hypothetical protein
MENTEITINVTLDQLITDIYYTLYSYLKTLNSNYEDFFEQAIQRFNYDIEEAFNLKVSLMKTQEQKEAELFQKFKEQLLQDFILVPKA